MNCLVCGIEVSDKAKTCSPRCRKLLSRQTSVTNNVSVTKPVEASVTYEFYTISKANGMGRTEDEKSPTRKAKYWYDVPLGAVPIIKKDWPKMPSYMNGRQYFLWWKNEFKTNNDPEKGEVGTPIIHNPFKVSSESKYA